MEEGRIRRAELVGAKAPSPLQALTLLVQLHMKPNPPLQLTGPWCVYLPTVSASPRSSGSVGQRSLSDTFCWSWVRTMQGAGFGKQRFWKAKVLLTFFSLFWIQRNCSHVSIFLTQLPVSEAAGRLLGLCLPPNCCYKSSWDLHWLQYTLVNRRQLQSYTQIVMVAGTSLQKRHMCSRCLESLKVPQ